MSAVHVSETVIKDAAEVTAKRSGYVDQSSEYKTPVSSEKLGVSAYDTSIRPDSLPEFPMLNLRQNGSTSLNDTILTQNLFKLHGSQPTLYHDANYHANVATLYGYKTPLQCSKPVSLTSTPYEAPKNISYDSLLGVMSSAEYGYHMLDKSVLELNSKRRNNVGDSLHTHRYGLERFSRFSANNAQNKRSFDMTVDGAIGSTDNIKINTDLVGPRMAAARNF